MPTPDAVARLHHLDPTIIGERLRHARVAAGLGQLDVATKVGISISYVSRIESGKRRCDIRLLERIAEACAVTAESILGPDPRTLPAVTYPDLEFAELALELGDATTALTHLDTVSAEPGLPSAVTMRLGLLRGRSLENLGRLPEAADVLESLDIESASTAQWVELSLTLSRCYREAGEVQQAIRVGERALDHLEKRDLAGSDEAVQLTVTVAAAYFEQGDRAFALRLCRRGLEAAEAMGTPRARASAYWNCAIMEQEQGQTGNAVDMARRALALLGEGSDQRSIARLRSELANMELRLDPPDLDEAERNLHLAQQQMVDSSANQLDVLRNEVWLVRLALLRGNFEQALTAALVVADALAVLDGSTPQLEADTFVVAGEAATGMGDASAARTYLQRAVLALSGAGDDRSAAQLWMDLGEQLRSVGEHQAAADAFQRAAACAGVVVHQTTRHASRPV